ncbi:MAG: adenosylcobinamide-phosphate synthase CbiB [Pseudomonadota bacterium]
MDIFSAVVAAVLLDMWLGEPRRWHPLVGYGTLVSAIENKLYPPADNSDTNHFLRGLAAIVLSLAPLVLIAGLIASLLDGIWLWCANALILYLAIGHASLRNHAMAVFAPLQQNDIDGARAAVAKLVSRDTESFGEREISGATVESVLENGSDAAFAAIFWFAVGGIPGVVLYRLSNTLDAMWGYKNDRYLHFGRAAARLDDALNWIPARLTAVSYALLGNFSAAIDCWRTQGTTWKSPNAGPVMAAGAGAIGVVVGGDAVYHGAVQHRQTLGVGDEPTAGHIQQALTLVARSLVLWLVVLLIIDLSI